MDRIDDLLRRMPVRPLVAQRVLESVEDPTVPLSAVATVVSMDPGLATRILRLANSSAHAGRGPAMSVERAVMMLGMDTVRAIVSAGAFSLLRDDVDLGPRGFWGHALGVAAAAAVAARPLGVSSDEAFTAGILHDIGSTIQHYSDASAFAALDDTRDPSTRLARERSAFGADHASLGSEAVARWGVPAPLVEAIRDHHSPPRAAGRLTQAVILGEAVATELDGSSASEPVRSVEDLVAELRVPVRPEVLLRETRRRYDRLAELAEQSS